jgi:hypothetical protein
MPRTIKADGRTITVPDDVTPEEINQIVGPAPTPTPAPKSFTDSLTEIRPHNLKSLLPGKNGQFNAGAYAHEAGTALGNIGAGGLGVILHPVKTAEGALESIGGMITAPGEMLAGRKFGETIPGQLVESMRTQPLETVEQGIGQAGATAGVGEVAGGALKVPGKVGEILKSKYGPREVPVGGEKVPVTVGEAEPSSAAGRKQLSLKKSGVGAPKFDRVEKVQQDKIKKVIRDTAQKTSGLIGPMEEQPGAALKSAADATFERARPMYASLDEELVTVPGDLHSASAIVKKAITRAKALGYDFESSQKSHYGEDPLGMGKPVSDSSHPLTDFQKIRSELGKMRRGSHDAAMRYQISEEIKQMTDAMDKSLDNTGLKDTWKEADRLWSKGYALNSIADSLKGSTEGVESSIQPKNIEAIPSEIKGKALEETLKDLSDDGTLARGLAPDEISNLRQSANILKRIQGTSTGTGYGESGSRSRAIAHTLRGAPGPIVGAGIGGAIGLLHGEFMTGLEAGGFAGFIAQNIGERALVNVMTKLDGVKALKAVAEAKSPLERQAALKALAAVAAISQPKKRSGDILPKTQ